MGEKTEKATPKKLRDAKKKGQVAKSQDLPSAFTFMASVLLTLNLAPWLYHKMADFLLYTFHGVSNEQVLEQIPGAFYQALILIFVTSIPVMGAIAVLGSVITFLSVGPVFAPEVFKFDIKKFDPIQNLKSKFKMKTLVELLKSVAKISIAGYIIYLVMYRSIPVLIRGVSVSMPDLLLIFYAFLVEVVMKVGLFFLVIAIFDFIYQKHTFAKEMMMEKFEIKQEYKNTEGDPLIKHKRKEIAREIAYQDSPAAGVSKAKAVVTNPIHLAIALGYDPQVDVAPYVLAKGNEEAAAEIVKIAEQYQIPVLRNIPLAHKLWEEGELYQYVPEETYLALAELLRWIEAMEQGSAEMYHAEE
jgi:type III secretion protein U